jgi:hypothetical protein
MVKCAHTSTHALCRHRALVVAAVLPWFAQLFEAVANHERTISLHAAVQRRMQSVPNIDLLQDTVWGRGPRQLTTAADAMLVSPAVLVEACRSASETVTSCMYDVMSM